jgi:hypothetical protein
MKKVGLFVSAVIIVWLMVVAFLYAIKVDKSGTVVYNCQLAEISPDFPIKAKEGCRKLRMDEINEQRTIQGDSITSGR